MIRQSWAALMLTLALVGVCIGGYLIARGLASLVLQAVIWGGY